MPRIIKLDKKTQRVTGCEPGKVAPSMESSAARLPQVRKL